MRVRWNTAPRKVTIEFVEELQALLQLLTVAHTCDDGLAGL